MCWKDLPLPTGVESSVDYPVMDENTERNCQQENQPQYSFPHLGLFVAIPGYKHPIDDDNDAECKGYHDNRDNRG